MIIFIPIIPGYLRQLAIITPYNEIVDSINSYVLESLSGIFKTYFSNDYISKGPDQMANQELLYLIEFLNSSRFSSIPDHELKLKLGSVVMLLRNVDQNYGLCNSSRILITQLAPNVIEGRIISGVHSNNKVFIPRIIITIKHEKWPFVLNRKQFPLRLSCGMTINKS